MSSESNDSAIAIVRVRESDLLRCGFDCSRLLEEGFNEEQLKLCAFDAFELKRGNHVKLLNRIDD